MTFAEIKDQVMFQTNNDAEDIADFLPHVNDYINEGYDRLVKVWTKSHLPREDYPWLTEDTDVPELPEWTHRAIADWATWLCYRNGNPQKQQRGMAYRNAFEEICAMMADEGGAAGLNADGTSKQYKNFINIPL
jgi:phosphatidylethanolamine-binding protein (PEBP) family uncharacterized protein